MNIIMFLVIALTGVQLWVCHFSLWWLICFVSRLLFCVRIIGVLFDVKKLTTAEGVSLGCMLIWNMMFSGSNFPWLRLLLQLIISASVIGLMFLDHCLYVYVVEDFPDGE